MRKNVTAILTASIILVSILAPALFTNNAFADQTDWYRTVKGVLDSDYYALYPFEKNSLTIGFSKYGEFINPYTGDGLNYSGRDPFANEGVNMTYWINGWFLDLRYVHRSYGARHIWAMATFADMANYGGDWLNGHTDPYGEPYGGRKCSAVATTEPINVLYDGPRRFVARLVTHIKDKQGALTWNVVDVIFTIVFEKVKKQVIVFKDVKLTIDSKILASPVDVQFSNRGEWDLGPSPDWKSYAHFYHQRFGTVYGADWHLSKNITREHKYVNASFTGTSINLTEYASDGYGLPVVLHSEYVYVNDVWLKRGADYTINYTTGIIQFTQALSKAKVEIYWKFYKLDEKIREPMALPNLYDVAQIIARDKKVVGYAAFWPVLSDYTVDGWDYCLEPLYGVSMNDMESEPDIPFVIGEWDFLLDYDEITPNWGEQFRGVTVYGIVNYHDAVDGGQLDREIRYQLDEVFNPWDLSGAVEKDSWRWVEFPPADGTWSSKELKYTPIRLEGKEWYEYCSFAERVLVDGKLLTPTDARIWDGSKWSWWPSFPYTYNITGNTIKFWKDADDKITTRGDVEWTVEEGKVVKVLYSNSNSTDTGRYEWTVVGRDSKPVDSIGASLVTAAFKNKGVEIGNAGLDMQYLEYDIQSVPNVMAKFGTGNAWADYYGGSKVTLLPTSTPGTRSALVDDWCKTWPVASSNMITVGGPKVNVLTDYLNDFAEAYYGTWDFSTNTGYGYYGKGAIVALSCWSKNYYYSTNETGYAVISTYKDLNGTVIFSVWGVWGRDTFYAAKWFHEKGILQDFPSGVTSIILEIDYTDPKHPTVGIVEMLGTISELILHPDP